MYGIITIGISFILAINGIVSVEDDGFIVDEDDTNSLSHAQQGISKIKKSSLLSSSSLKPVVRSMAMSSIGGSLNKGVYTKNGVKSVNIATDDTTTSNLLESKHIEPSIGLEQSLKNLDLVASKREEIHHQQQPSSSSEKHEEKNKNKDVKHSILHPSGSSALLPSNTTTTSLKANTTEQHEQQKKSASPNVLTNATITGFLSNNPKFTIDSVGTQQQDNKKTEGDIQKKKVTATKSTNVITVRDQVAKVTTEPHQILRIANDPMIAASKKDTLSDNTHSDNNTKPESPSTSATSNKKDITFNNKAENSTSSAKNNTDSKITKSNIHVATEDDFNKLRYIKRKEIEENAVKKEVL